MTTPNRPSAFARFLGHPPTTLDRALLASLIGVVSLILICACCVFVPGALFRSGGSSTVNNQSNAVLTATATGTPIPTATPSGPQPLTEAVLGGKIDAFTSKYGDPTRSWDGGGIYSTTINGTPVIINASSNPGNDGSLHIITVEVTPESGVYGPGFDLQTAHDTCSKFVPSDAVHTADKTLDDGSTDYVFKSARLALTLPASRFHDPHNQPVPAGTLHINSAPSDSAPGRVAFCEVEPGRY